MAFLIAANAIILLIIIITSITTLIISGFTISIHSAAAITTTSNAITTVVTAVTAAGVVVVSRLVVMCHIGHMRLGGQFVSIQLNEQSLVLSPASSHAARHQVNHGAHIRTLACRYKLVISLIGYIITIIIISIVTTTTRNIIKPRMIVSVT